MLLGLAVHVVLIVGLRAGFASHKEAEGEPPVAHSSCTRRHGGILRRRSLRCIAFLQ